MCCIFILQLIEAQHQISQYKQRCEELSAQLSSLSTADTVPTAIYDKLSQVCMCGVCQLLNHGISVLNYRLTLETYLSHK